MVFPRDLYNRVRHLVLFLSRGLFLSSSGLGPLHTFHCAFFTVGHLYNPYRFGGYTSDSNRELAPCKGGAFPIKLVTLNVWWGPKDLNLQLLEYRRVTAGCLARFSQIPDGIVSYIHFMVLEVELVYRIR